MLKTKHRVILFNHIRNGRKFIFFKYIMLRYDFAIMYGLFSVVII